ncbi:hypothetical protein F4680DRAFT_454448 [Xylaria scruposa]|nr:hypothetical protein F4680DRAFT_454448 [Xylaria scruposa]
MASVILTNGRYPIVDVLTTSRNQQQNRNITRPNTSPTPNSKERLRQLYAACEVLSDLAERSQSAVSIAIQPQAILTEQLEYDKNEIGIASRQVENLSREQALEGLQMRWLRQEREIFETERKMRRLEADIMRLQMEEAIERGKMANQTNDKWWGKAFSFAFGAASRRSKDAMAKRERDLNRKYSIETKREAMLTRSNELSVLETAMQITERAIENFDEEI